MPRVRRLFNIQSVGYFSEVDKFIVWYPTAKIYEAGLNDYEN